MVFFSTIAEYILSQGGVVFGAGFDNTFHSVKHSAVESSDGLNVLRGSKYLQSELGTTYTDVKAHLEHGRIVLFTGTPCQVSGLKSFLQKEYDNLYTQDIVCHGVPAPAVWDAYLGYLEKRFDHKATSVSFRNKKEGWKNYRLSVQFDNGTAYTEKYSSDVYMRGFLHNCYLRPSCYVCQHKGVEREADITLADCWGIEKLCPELNDNKGTSLILVSSGKGKRLLDMVGHELTLKKADLAQALQYNQSMVKSANVYSKYAEFEDSFRQKPINVLLRQHCSVSLLKRIECKIRSVLKG